MIQTLRPTCVWPQICSLTLESVFRSWRPPLHSGMSDCALQAWTSGKERTRQGWGDTGRGWQEAAGSFSLDLLEPLPQELRSSWGCLLWGERLSQGRSLSLLKRRLLPGPQPPVVEWSSRMKLNPTAHPPKHHRRDWIFQGSPSFESYVSPSKPWYVEPCVPVWDPKTWLAMDWGGFLDGSESRGLPDMSVLTHWRSRLPALTCCHLSSWCSDSLAQLQCHEPGPSRPPSRVSPGPQATGRFMGASGRPGPSCLIH